jgi:hypothetical protein
MDVDGVHADASLPASPSLHAVSMPAFAPCMGFKPEWRQPFCTHSPLCCTMEPSHYPGVTLP